MSLKVHATSVSRLLKAITNAEDEIKILESQLSTGEPLRSAEVIEQLRKPTALVCSSRGLDTTTLAGGGKSKDDKLLEMIDGHPLALQILGRRAAGGEAVDELKAYWSVEASRRAGPKDTRGSSIDFSGGSSEELCPPHPLTLRDL